MPELNRRHLLGLLGLGGAAVQLGACKPEPEPTPAPTREREPEPSARWSGLGTLAPERFPLSVSSGDPTEQAAICWTRYAGDAALELHHALWTGEGWQPQEPTPTTPGEGGFTHAELVDLPADTWVSYQFVDAQGSGSPVGLLRTAPTHDDPATVQIGITSCLHQRHDAFPTLTHARARGPLDLFLFLGDTAYFDGRDTREQFRELYAEQLVRPGFRDVLPHTATVFTWDDHEFTNNLDPVTIDPDLLHTAREAWFEHLPVRRDPSEPTRIWRSLRHGKTVELFVLDARTERDAATGRYLSRAQLDWLKQGLASSDAVWKLIANSVPITSFDNPVWDVPLALNDRWEAYPAQRDELLSFLEAEQLTGVLFLSGDVHCGMIARLDPSGPRQRFLDLICGPGGSTRNVSAPFLMGQQIPWAVAEYNAARLELRADGLAIATFLGESDEVLATITMDDHGTILELLALDLTTGDTVDLTPAPIG